MREYGLAHGGVYKFMSGGEWGLFKVGVLGCGINDERVTQEHRAYGMRGVGS